MNNITNEELSLLIEHSTGHRHMELVRDMVKRMDALRIFNNEVMDNEVHRLVLIQLDMFLDVWEPEDYEWCGYVAALESVLDMLFETTTNTSSEELVKNIPDCFKACL